ncbi:uncharacterized protein LOC110448504 [Mizuhopecten yessoensis]|uniref:uncharacterized protein LOC110448504 n=1 Tax=Mizuhopecten yessoensis TaxID=6573 RepID=UPI000B45C225|nr:uncharacterized protein LOC110448504 [Mizuhopecten yessoensis]
MSHQQENPEFCLYRKGYRCQSTLLRLLEDWRRAMDESKFVGAILMDLSKAFDCIPNGLLLEKLTAYGLDEAAVGLISSYIYISGADFSGLAIYRLGSNVSDWEQLEREYLRDRILTNFRLYPLGRKLTILYLPILLKTML